MKLVQMEQKAIFNFFVHFFMNENPPLFDVVKYSGKGMGEEYLFA